MTVSETRVVLALLKAGLTDGDLGSSWIGGADPLVAKQPARGLFPVMSPESNTTRSASDFSDSSRPTAWTIPAVVDTERPARPHLPQR